MNRRDILKWLGLAPVAAAVPAVALTEPRPALTAADFDAEFDDIYEALDLSAYKDDEFARDFAEATLRNYSSQLSENITNHNALLRMMNERAKP